MSWQILEGDCLELLPIIGAVDHIITDPPYSKHVHSKHMVGVSLPDTAEFSCRFRRKKEIGFEAITSEQITACAEAFERLCRRWCLVFSNVELCQEWARAFPTFDYVRTGAWVKLGATPQFTGDRPAAGFEVITIMHPKGRKKWNGGGKQGVWSIPIEANRLGNRGERVHPTQKPLALMLKLVEDFTDPGDLILDPFCGSGTTLCAALRLGRRCIGIEKNPEWAELARERCRAEVEGSTIGARQRGQEALFK